MSIIPDKLFKQLDKVNTAVEAAKKKAKETDAVFDESAALQKALSDNKMSETMRSYVASLDKASAAELTFKERTDLTIAALKEQALAWVKSPLGVTTIAAVVIFAVVKAVQFFTTSLEESRDALADLKEEFDSIKSELSSLESELETTKDRIEELQALDSLSFTEQEELENLQAENAELERKINLLKLEQELKQKEINSTFVETASRDLNAKHRSMDNMVVTEMGDGSSMPAFGTEGNYLDSQLQKYQETQQALVNLETQFQTDYTAALAEGDEKSAAKIKESFEKKKAEYEADITDIETYFGEKMGDFSEYLDGVSYIDEPTSEDEEAVNAWITMLEDWQDRMAIALGDDGAKSDAFTRLISTEFADATEELKKLGQLGDVTGDMLGNMLEGDEGLRDFIDKLIELGVISSDSEDELQKLADAFNELQTSAYGGSDAYSQALSNFSNIASTIESVSSALTTVADLQKEVADGFTMDIDKALEFAKTYPEILNNATVAANGQIQLNSDVVNAFISGKEEELKAQVDSEIAQLEADKTVLEAKLAFAQGQLGLAKSVAEGEGQISKESSEYIVQAGNAAAQAMIEAGMDEATAYELAAAAMAGNMEEFDRVVAEVCTDTDGNFNEAAYNAAHYMYLNMRNAAGSVDGVTTAAHNAAVAIAGIASGEVAGSTGTFTGSEGVGGSSFTTNVTSGSFNGTNFTYTPREVSLDDFITELELDIADYESAISQIDGQIAILKGIRSSDLSSFAADSGSSGSGSDSSTEDTLEQLDWIEIAINRIAGAINYLKSVASSAYKSISTRMEAAKDEIDLINQEIELQEEAYEKYLEKANEVGLSDDLKKLVQNGSIDVEEYDSDTKELIDSYQELYEKAQEAANSIYELHESLAELYSDNFSTIQSNFDSRLSQFDHLANSYNADIDMLEAKGYLATTTYYEGLKDVEKQRVAMLQSELISLKKTLADAMASGEIEEGSEAWYDMRAAIDEVEEAIDEANLSLQEYIKTIRQIKWDNFDYGLERISRLTSEADFLIDLLDNKDLFDDKGNLTDEGLAIMGLYGQNYNTYMAQADEYGKEIANVEKQLAEDPGNTDLIDRLETLRDAQWECVQAAEEQKQSMIDLAEEGINAQIDAMDTLIEKYSDLLDSSKDLYEYRKKITGYTDDTEANVPTRVSITFDTEFPGAPTVVACPHTTLPGTGVTGVGVDSVTANGFDLYLTRASTTQTNIYWIAVYTRS